MDLDTMTQAYAVCALWSSPDEGQPPFSPERNLDDDYGIDDIAPETMAAMRADCEAFAEANAGDIDTFERLACVDDSQVGHSFWLSRNGHGAGFFDWTHPAELGEACARLQEAARVYGEIDLYAHDGQVWA